MGRVWGTMECWFSLGAPEDFSELRREGSWDQPDWER